MRKLLIAVCLVTALCSGVENEDVIGKTEQQIEKLQAEIDSLKHGNQLPMDGKATGSLSISMENTTVSCQLTQGTSPSAVVKLEVEDRTIFSSVRPDGNGFYTVTVSIGNIDPPSEGCIIPQCSILEGSEVIMVVSETYCASDNSLLLRMVDSTVICEFTQGTSPSATVELAVEEQTVDVPVEPDGNGFYTATVAIGNVDIPSSGCIIPQCSMLEGSQVIMFITHSFCDTGSQSDVMAFSVYVSQDENPSGEILRFDDILFNGVNSYDAFTGIFRAPVSGVWSFNTFFKTQNAEITTFSLYHDGNLLCTGVGDGTEDTGTCSAVVEMLEGDTAYIINEGGAIWGEDRSSGWTGFLVEQTA